MTFLRRQSIIFRPTRAHWSIAHWRCCRAWRKAVAFKWPAPPNFFYVRDQFLLCDFQRYCICILLVCKHVKPAGKTDTLCSRHLMCPGWATNLDCTRMKWTWNNQRKKNRLAACKKSHRQGSDDDRYCIRVEFQVSEVYTYDQHYVAQVILYAA